MIFNIKEAGEISHTDMAPAAPPDRDNYRHLTFKISIRKPLLGLRQQFCINNHVRKIFLNFRHDNVIVYVSS